MVTRHDLLYKTQLNGLQYCCCSAGLVGSAYHIVAYQPETAVEALTRATSGTATMGKTK